MEDTQKDGGFTLPDTKIIVKFIPHKTGMAANVDKGHVIEGGMLVNAVKKYCAPIARNGSIKNVLTKEEKEYLESKTGLNLSVYGDYWTTHYVSLFKEDASNILNLSNPRDYISYKILCSLTDDIAPNWKSRYDKLSYQFAITEEGEEMQEAKTKYDAKKQAFKLYGKIEDDKEQLMGVLRLLENKPISEETSLLFLQTKIESLIDANPLAFVNVVQDKKLHTKMLINEGISKKVIIKKNNKYYTADGLDLCNAGEIPTFDNAVNYLQNPSNSEVRDIIEAKINKLK